MTVATPKMAPIAPWYLPRSRSGMTSAISAIAVTSRPPAPMPCIPRQAISIVMFVAGPHRNEPVMKMITDAWKTTLRPKRSPNLPTSTVATVSASRYAVTTHDMCAAPPRSDTIVGRAVPTIVWSRAARSMPSMIVTKTMLRRSRLSSTGGVGASTAGRAESSVVVTHGTLAPRCPRRLWGGRARRIDPESGPPPYPGRRTRPRNRTPEQDSRTGLPSRDPQQGSETGPLAEGPIRADSCAADMCP